MELHVFTAVVESDDEVVAGDVLTEQGCYLESQRGAVDGVGDGCAAVRGQGFAVGGVRCGQIW